MDLIFIRQLKSLSKVKLSRQKCNLVFISRSSLYGSVHIGGSQPGILEKNRQICMNPSEILLKLSSPQKLWTILKLHRILGTMLNLIWNEENLNENLFCFVNIYLKSTTHFKADRGTGLRCATSITAYCREGDMPRPKGLSHLTKKKKRKVSERR